MRDAQDVDVLTKTPTSSVTKPLGIAIPVAVAVVIADQVTKRWALNALESGPCSTPDNCIDLFAGIKFHLVFNTGAAFTRGSGFGPVLAVLAFFMGGFLLYLATRRTDRLGIALFGAVAGGAAGNLVDRIFRADDGIFSGAVVDFIDVGWWPVFNIADMAIVIGVISIIVLTFFEGVAEEAEPDDDAPDDDIQVDEALGDESVDDVAKDADDASIADDVDLDTDDFDVDADDFEDGESADEARSSQSERTE